MITYHFGSATNLDGFVQLIASRRLEHEVDHDRCTVTVFESLQWVEDNASQWNGEQA